MPLPAYEAFNCYWFSIQPPNLSWTGPPALWRQWLTDPGGLKHQTSLVQVVFGADVKCEGEKMKATSRAGHLTAYWYSPFFFFFCHDEFQTPNEKIPALDWRQGLFRVTLCVLKHKGARLSVSPGLLGTNQQDTEWVSVLDCVWGGGVKEMAVGGVELRTSPCSSHGRPGEDRGNEELHLKWLAMVQSQHSEGRPKASWVENTALDKSTFPFCAPDIIKNPWISNSHPQEQHRRLLFFMKIYILVFNIIDTKKKGSCE